MNIVKTTELVPGTVYYFDLSLKTKGVFVMEAELIEGYKSYYFAPIGNVNDYIKSSMFEGLVGFNGIDHEWIECENQ